MHLTTRDVTRYFSVAEATIQRWVKRRGLPVHRVNGHLRYSPAELLEWATANQVQVSPELFDLDASSAVPVSLAEAIEMGGIHYGVADSTKEAALRAVVELIPAPASADRQALLDLLLAREALGSTALGGGIAIPHVRRPMVLSVERPSITLCFLEKPVDFGAPDGVPVGILFSLICPTVRHHLQLLARLSFALLDAEFKETVLRQAPSADILREARRIDGSLESKADREEKGVPS